MMGLITARKSLLLLLLSVAPLTAALNLRRDESKESTTTSNCGIGTDTQDTADVLLNFVGQPDVLQDSDYADLEKVFQETLDTLAENRCFNLDRVSIDTTTEDLNEVRMLYENNSQRNLASFSFTFSFAFNILYNCNGCGGVFLWNDGSRRTLLDALEANGNEETNRFFEERRLTDKS